VEKILLGCQANSLPRSAQSAVMPSLWFKFNKRRHLFIRTHNETLSIVAMCVSNPDRSPVGINR
jgi:hypothetical protein